MTGADQIKLAANLNAEITGARHGWGNETELTRLKRQKKKMYFFQWRGVFSLDLPFNG